MKIVINRCHGGFQLSTAALRWLHARGAAAVEAVPAAEGIHDEEHRRLAWEQCQAVPAEALYAFNENGSLVLSWAGERTDPLLVECVETLGTETASGGCASLKVVEIPDGVQWYIDDCAGNETIHEEHRRWR